MKLSSEKKEMILKTIEIRLEEIGEATKRAKITFIIAIVASCSMLVTLWSTYHSWTKRRSFDPSYGFTAKTPSSENESLFVNKLEDFFTREDFFTAENIKGGKEIGYVNEKGFIEVDKNEPLKNKFLSEEKTGNGDESEKPAAEEQPEKEDLEKENGDSKKKGNTEKALKGFFDTINEKVLTDKDFYKKIDDLQFYRLIYGFPWYRENYFVDLDLAKKFKKPGPLSEYLDENFSQNTRYLLNSSIEKDKVEKGLPYALTTDLNNLIEGSKLIYEESKFKDVELSEPIKESLKKITEELNAKEESSKQNPVLRYKITCLNRLLLDVVYQDIEENRKKAKYLKQRIEADLLDDDTLEYYNGTNHLNKFILQNLFPEIKWEPSSSSHYDDKVVFLYEHNRRAVSTEWIQSQNVNIGLLGVNVSVDQFSLLGSFTLMIISFWMLFSFRRENRAIVSLLRDVKNEVGRPNSRAKKDDLWDIANLTFHGIAHKFIFAHTGRSDKPMSKQDIFRGKYTIWQKIINLGVAGLIRIIRFISLALLFLPIITITAILYDDIYTTEHSMSPYTKNSAISFIQTAIGPWSSQITTEVEIGAFFGLITLLGCLVCLILQIRTVQALREFERRLYPNKYTKRGKSNSYLRIK
jgi:hypothetical protein